MRLARGLLIFLLLLLPASGFAFDSGKFSVELIGAGPQPVMLTPETLAGLLRVEKDVTFQTSKGPSSGHYEGVLFWDVLKANKAFEGVEHNAELRKTFVVTASDDYVIAFSVGEIHPDFGNVQMILADKVDDKPFEGGYRIIVPGDTRGARNVRDVIRIEIR